jgi:hypothetical protein
VASPAHAILRLALVPALAHDLLHLELLIVSWCVLAVRRRSKWLQLADMYRDTLLWVVDVLNDAIQVGDLLDDPVRARPRALKLDRCPRKVHRALAHEDLLPDVHERIHVLVVLVKVLLLRLLRLLHVLANGLKRSLDIFVEILHRWMRSVHSGVARGAHHAIDGQEGLAAVLQCER